MTIRQRLACWVLEWSERVFLRTHGWSRSRRYLVSGGSTVYYRPPEDYPFRDKGEYGRAHAVNAQKQLVYNPAYRQTS